MFLVLVCKQNVLFRGGFGKVKSHHPSVPDSNLPYVTFIPHNYSLFQPYVSQMAPGSSDQLGASEPGALWVIC